MARIPPHLLRAATVFQILPKQPVSSSIFRSQKLSLFLNSPKSYARLTKTPYPLQYEMVVPRPVNPYPQKPRRRHKPPPPDSKPDSEPDFDKWVDEKLADKSDIPMDRSKKKYYRKRELRMYGSDFDEDDGRGEKSEFVEVKQDLVEFKTYHQREEELYFYDAFAYPWEKDKHYKMMYQLEKKYFPDQGFEKAFLEPGESNNKRKSKKKEDDYDDDVKLTFFDEQKSEGKEKEKDKGLENEAKIDVTQKKVEEFFKGLKKVPNKESEVVGEQPFLATRRTGLPPKWDSQFGTVVLVNKPKGWTSFTVCGKLRRLVNVKKVGHAGTLDPMATGLLIVCVGKATKLVDQYQGMIKGYSGVFRLGETTSTLDADSPVIQREPWEHIKDEDLKKAAASFLGEIWQVPPMFSAVKVGGEPMYKKARRGESVELSARRISIFQFEVERSLDDRQNVIFRVTCSKGTYVRSLCADFAKSLNSCAHLTALRRDSIGEYSADDAWEFKELEESITKDYL